MEKVDIKKLFYKKQCQMLASFNLTSTLTHPVSKGDATEDEWRNWFNDYFPKRYRAEKAFVIDCEGNRSEQMDVVIYDTHFSPTIFQINDEKFIPAESVYAVFPFPLSSRDRCINVCHSSNSIAVFSVLLFLKALYKTNAKDLDNDSAIGLIAKSLRIFSGTKRFVLFANIARIIKSISLFAIEESEVCLTIPFTKAK